MHKFFPLEDEPPSFNGIFVDNFIFEHYTKIRMLHIECFKETGMEISIELRELQPFLNERGQLKNWPAKKKRKVLALWYLAGQMEMGKVYSEAEINTLLDEWTVFHDPATLRRELFNHFLLNRTADGRQYWRAEEIPSLEAFLTKYL